MLSVLTIGAWADTYTPLEFISNTNSGRTNTYYDTGYTPNAKTKVEIKFRITNWYIDSNDKWAAIFSGRTANNNGISLFVNGGASQLGYFVSDLGSSGDTFLNQTLSLNTDYTATASLTNLKVTDGTNNYSKIRIRLNGKRQTSQSAFSLMFVPTKHFKDVFTIAIFTRAMLSSIVLYLY